MNINFVGWDNPVTHDEARMLYEELYGEDGARYLAVLKNAPPENAVISRLIAHLMRLVEVN